MPTSHAPWTKSVLLPKLSIPFPCCLLLNLHAPGATGLGTPLKMVIENGDTNYIRRRENVKEKDSEAWSESWFGVRLKGWIIWMMIGGMFKFRLYGIALEYRRQIKNLRRMCI